MEVGCKGTRLEHGSDSCRGEDHAEQSTPDNVDPWRNVDHTGIHDDQDGRE